MKVEWVERVCPLCNSSEARVFAESNIDLAALDGFAFASRKLPEYMHPRLLECGVCGMVYGSPVFTAETLAAAYQTASFDSGREAHYASATYAGQVRGLLERLPDLRGALDIGTGDGAFLEELLGLGFRDVRGVEPSEAPVAAAKDQIRPLIRVGVFRPQEFAASSLSLVSCFQTMEHVWDPAGMVRQACGLLKPGGVMMVVVHDRKAWTARLMGRRSPIFDIEHLQLFCAATARRLLEQAGLGDVTVAGLWNRYPIEYWAKLLPVPGGVKRPLLALMKGSGLGQIPVAIRPGNLVCWGFRGRGLV